MLLTLISVFSHFRTNGMKQHMSDPCLPPDQKAHMNSFYSVNQVYEQPKANRPF